MNAAILVCLTASLPGCKPPILSVDDAVTLGDKLRIVAYVEKEPVLGLRRDVEKVRVDFYLNGASVGDDKTDGDGRADVKCRLPNESVSSFEARAVVDGVELRAQGAIHRWTRDRTIIAVDIDETISKTEYRPLILEDRDKKSDPVHDSRKTLRKLSADYHIVYVTARPRFLLDKTRRWLSDEKFPRGPVVTARGLRQWMRPRQHKTRALEDLRDDWPNLLIGIGNNANDAAAYGANKMLALIIPPDRKDIGDIGRHAIILRDWDAVADVFEANREVFGDRKQLERAVKGKRLLSLPVWRWDGD